MAVCYHCGKSLNDIIQPVARSETCPDCGNDVRVCRNCLHYDPSSYNECREVQADRVVDKEKGNFCDYFSLAGGTAAGVKQTKADVLKQLDDLFKK